jgi:uncharacterized membrane protein
MVSDTVTIGRRIARLALALVMSVGFVAVFNVPSAQAETRSCGATQVGNTYVWWNCSYYAKKVHFESASWWGDMDVCVPGKSYVGMGNPDRWSSITVTRTYSGPNCP